MKWIVVVVVGKKTRNFRKIKFNNNFNFDSCCRSLPHTHTLIFFFIFRACVCVYVCYHLQCSTDRMMIISCFILYVAIYFFFHFGFFFYKCWIKCRIFILVDICRLFLTLGLSDFIPFLFLEFFFFFLAFGKLLMDSSDWNFFFCCSVDFLVKGWSEKFFFGSEKKCPRRWQWYLWN